VSSPLSGLRAWIVQRVTAVYVAAFLVYAAAYLMLAPPVSFEAWRAWVGSPAISVASALFFGALLLHAWIGIRDVVLDYVHPLPLRFVILVGVGLALVAQGIWVLRILYGAVA